MTFLAVLVASFLHVSLKAWANIAIIGGHWLRVPPASFGIALVEVFVVASIVREGFALVVPIALGGVLGAWSAMFLHREIERAKGMAE